MLSAEAASRAVTSTEDPETPSGNDSEPLRAGLGLEVRREAGKSLLSGLRRSGQGCPGSRDHGSSQLTAVYTPLLPLLLCQRSNAVTQTFSN